MDANKFKCGAEGGRARGDNPAMEKHCIPRVQQSYTSVLAAQPGNSPGLEHTRHFYFLTIPLDPF